MRLLRQLFLPQRMDACALVVGIFVALISLAIALFGYDRALILQLTIVLVATTSYAVGAAAGCQQISFARSGILAFGLIAACVTVFMLVEKEMDLGVFDLGVVTRLCSKPIYIGLLPLLSLASFLCHWPLRLLADRLSNRVSSVKREGQQRLRWLIGLALLMYVIHQVVQLSQFQFNPIVVGAVLIVPIVFSYWISDTLTGTWSWLKVCLCSVAAIVVLFAVIAAKPKWSGVFPISIPIAVALLAAGSGRSRRAANTTEDPANASEQPVPQVRSGLPVLRTSLGGLFCILAAVAFLAVPSYLHVPTLFDGRTGLGFWERLEFAGSVADFSRKSESRFSSVGGLMQSSLFEFDFSSYSSAEALTKADKLFSTGIKKVPWQWDAINLKNLHPEVQTNVKNFRVRILVLEHGTITTKQLEELSAVAQFIFVSNLNIQSREKIKLSTAQIVLSEMSANQLQSFFDAIDPQFGPKIFALQDSITAEHWPVIAKASLYFPIDCQIDCDKEDLTKFPRVPTKHLKVNFVLKRTNSNFAFSSKLLRSPAFCDNSINFSWLDSGFEPLSSILEASLLLRGRSNLRDTMNAYESISDWKADRLLVYERDENGNALALLCPLRIDEDFPTAGLENLRTLTFDLGWIERREKVAGVPWMANLRRMSVEPVGKLSKLERLAFPSDYPFEQLQFLSNLPNLKQLEIALGRTPVEEYVAFESLQALEQLILLDEPADEILEVLAKLKRLEQLTIVLPNSSGQKKLLQKSVKKILPQIKLSMIEEKDYQPDVPSTFKKHFSQVIQELKAKIAASEGTPKDQN